MMNNHNSEQSIVSLGKLTFNLDLDTAQFSIQVENKHTGQLTSPEEVTGLMPQTGLKLFCEEMKRRSRSTIVT